LKSRVSEIDGVLGDSKVGTDSPKNWIYRICTWWVA
jgi:hypothetical protein